MTGPSDSIFCECRVISKKFEVLIVLELRFMNQKGIEMNNVLLELNCVGA